MQGKIYSYYALILYRGNNQGFFLEYSGKMLQDLIDNYENNLSIINLKVPSFYRKNSIIVWNGELFMNGDEIISHGRFRYPLDEEWCKLKKEEMIWSNERQININ